jgi:hypothetical protein
VRAARLAAVPVLVAWAAVGAGVHGQGSAAGDRAALTALYEATDGPNWHVATNWLSSEPLSAWAGVTVDDGGRVTWLALGGNNLRGSLPAELGDLTRLNALDLLFNELTGSIPAELGNLARLWRLDLQENRLTGAIPPSLGNLPDLELLILANNELTGSIPASLARPPRLWSLVLSNNDLTGPIPGAFGGMPNIRFLSFGANSLSGTLPASLGDLRTLEWLQVGFNAGLTGELPAGLARPPVNVLDIHGTGICVPGTDRFRAWAAGIRFEPSGRTCGTAPPDVPVIDLAVFYTPAAREAAGGTSSIEAVIDLMVAETNRAYLDSGVRQKVALVAREEAPYRESGSSIVDLERLTNPADGHLDGVHPVRDIVGADLVHLIVERASVLGVAHLAPRAARAFGLTCRRCGGLTFAHELGHNMGLGHDRHTACGGRGSCVWAPHYPYAFGYVNDRAFEPAPPPSAGWYTIMAYATRCGEAGIACRPLALFSDPGTTRDGDPTGAAGERDAAGVRGPADAVRALNEVRHSVASFRPSVPRRGRGPVPAGRLPDRTLQVGGAAVVVDVSGAFRHPGGGALSYRALSSVASAVDAKAAGSLVTIAPVSEGLSTVTVIATGDAGDGTSAWQQFAVVVDPAGARDYDTDDDGLIEIRTLAQLDAVRYDPTGAGDPLFGRSEYDEAFSGRSRRMGCPRGSCRGYELLADLDFDTNRSGGPDPGDAWWNDGAGWPPIGTTVFDQFDTILEGNGHAIRNLFIARDTDAGLFARIGTFAVVRRLRLVDVDVTGANAGGLAAENHGAVIASLAAGRVTGSDTAGGLVGATSGRIVNSSAACGVQGSSFAGGLAGWNIGNVVASYATGDVRANAAGGLVGENSGTITASYATGRVRGSAAAGGLAARNGAGAGIVASYAAAPVSGNAAFAGGLTGGGSSAGGRVESSYWDVGVSGQANSGGGEGRTTPDMRAPTGYDGIYRNWNRDLDGDGAADDPWDFGTTAEYPALKADVDGDGRSTWREFGDQPGRRGNPDPPPGQPPAGPPAGNCVPDLETFCFQNSRFAVEMDWWTSDGRSGAGKAAPERTNDSGMFWFFDPGNREVLVKVLNGCAVNDHVWVYAASATDLGYSIRVTDTTTDVVREYQKEDGLPAGAITDAKAFPGVCAADPAGR